MATTINVYQQTQNFCSNTERLNHNDQNRQTGNIISTMTFTTQQLNQQPNSALINQFNYQQNNEINSQQQQQSAYNNIDNEFQPIRIKNEDYSNDSPCYYQQSYYNDNNPNQNDDYYNFTSGPPSSSSSPLSSGSSNDSDVGYQSSSPMANSRDFMSEIDQACKMFAISADPYNWNQTDVRKWLMYQQNLHHLKPFRINNNFCMNGMALCELNLNDFHRKILESFELIDENDNNDKHEITWNYAKILFEELNIWRNAITKIIKPDFFDSSTPTTPAIPATMNLEQTQNSNEQFSMQSTSIMNNNQSNKFSSYCYGDDQDGDNHHVNHYNHQQMLNFVSHNNNNESENMYQYDNNNINSNMNCYNDDNLQSLPILYDPLSNNSVYSNSSPSSSPQRSLYCSSPAGSISSSSSSSITNNIYINNNVIIPQQLHSNIHQQLPQYKSSNHMIQSMNGKNQLYQLEYENIYNKGNDNCHFVQPAQHNPQEHMFQSFEHQQQFQFKSEYGSDDDMMSDNDDSINNNNISSKKYQQTNNSTKNSNQSIKQSYNGTRPHGSSTSIQLWQFLKELLSHPNQYEHAIRWLERSRGVFKIEDSVRVARLWGERKNRPAMNYDKLSRSIRQYYKKGIMKKTERAQRLVYQFCQPYAV